MQSEINFKNVPAERLKIQLMGIFMIEKGVFAETPVVQHLITEHISKVNLNTLN